jgi:hypothetical protein
MATKKVSYRVVEGHTPQQLPAVQGTVAICDPQATDMGHTPQSLPSIHGTTTTTAPQAMTQQGNVDTAVKSLDNRQASG